MPTLHDLIAATQAYYNRIVSDYAHGRFLADGAGQRLDEKPRKNYFTRLPACVLDCEEGDSIGARTQLGNCVNAWRDHVGLMIHYRRTNQMSAEHVMDYLGGSVTDAELTAGNESEAKEAILARLQFAPPQVALLPNAWSIGAEQYRRMALPSVCL